MNKINIIYILFTIIFCILLIVKLNPNNFTNTYDLPKIVWSYWGTNDLNNIPLSVKQILNDRNEKLKSKNWNIKMLNDISIYEYINKDEFPLNYLELSIQAQSDWIRLKLLQKYGGLWLDASLIINDIDSLERIYQDTLLEKSYLTAFYLEARTSNNDPYTFIESWFIMAPLKSNIINKWLEQFEKAVDMGFQEYLDNIKSTGYQNWGILEFGTYLIIHLCLQIILKDFDKSNILLYKADDTMYKIHTICNWDINCIHNKLLNDKTLKNIPYIKLRGIDRIDDIKSYFNL